MSILTKVKGFIASRRFPKSCIAPRPRKWDRIVIGPSELLSDKRLRSLRFKEGVELTQWHYVLNEIIQINDSIGVDRVNLTIVDVESYGNYNDLIAIDVINAFHQSDFNMFNINFKPSKPASEPYETIREVLDAPIDVQYQIDVIIIMSLSDLGRAQLLRLPVWS